MKILVVEDDPIVAQTLKLLFSSYSYAVDIATDGEAGFQMAEAFSYDLILLDVVLPKLDGVNLCQQLRTKGFQIPILLLTGQGEGRQKAIALNVGADDYVIKPFDAEELIARVQALLRRDGSNRQPILTWGKLSVDPSSCKVAYGTHLITVTPKEYAILELFLRQPQKVFSAAAILDRVWSSVESPGEEAVRVHIKGLRQKLTAVGAPKDFIKTVYRVGYQLNPRYSNFLAGQVEQQPTAPQIAELTLVNEELRLTLEELQVVEEELRQQNEELTSTQQLLELERQRYQDLFEFAPDAYFVTDVYGMIQEANSAASNLLHVEPQYLIGKPLLVFIAQVDRHEFYSRLAHCNFAQNWEVNVKPRKGDPVPVLVAVTSIKNLQDEIVGLRWSLRDIRSRKEMEQQLQAAHDELEMRVTERTAELTAVNQVLRQREEFLSSIYNGADEAVFVIEVTETNDLYYVAFNYRAEQYSGVSQQDIQGKTPEEAFGTMVGTSFRRNYERCLQAGRSISYEEHIVYDEHSIWTLTTLSPLRNEAGRIHRLIGTAIDITDRKQLELSLQTSEAKLNQIFNNASASIVSLRIFADRTLQYDYCSNGCEAIFGYSAAEMKSGTWWSRIPPEDQESVIRPAQAAILAERTMCSLHMEYRFWHKDGTLRWISSALSAYRDDQNDCWQVIAVDTDITEAKCNEAALHQSEAEFRAMFNVTSVGMAQAEPETRRFLRVNTAFCEITGYTEAELLTFTIDDINHPDDRIVDRQRYTKLVQGIAGYQSEKRYLRKDGSTVWVLATGNVIRNADGEPICTFSIVQDISDRKQAETALRESERRYHQILDSIADIVVVKQADSRLVWANQAFRDYYGMTLEDLQGIIDAPFNEPAYTLQYIHDDEFVFTTGQTLTVAEETITRHDGAVRTFSTIKAPIFDEAGQVVLLVGVCRDITDRKQLELSLKASEAKLNRIFDNAVAAIGEFRVYPDRSYRYEFLSAGCEIVYGYTQEEIQAHPNLWSSCVLPEDMEAVIEPAIDQILTGGTLTIEYRFRDQTDNLRWIAETLVSRWNKTASCWDVTSVATNITDRKQAEFTLKQQFLREQLIADISQDIRQSLDLNKVLCRTVERVRELLNTDRVIILRFRPNWVGDVIMESVGAGWQSILATTFSDPCFKEGYVIEPYQQGQVTTIFDVDGEDLEPCHVELLKQFQVKANLVVPIFQGEGLWGLLIAHHCSAPRQWQPSEIDLLQQLATQVSIAIQQSELYQQTHLELLERKRMQAVLQESEERFRTISAAAPVGICQTDANGLCLYTNARWQEMSGLSFEDSLGNGWLQAIHPEDLESISIAWEAYLQGGSERLPEFRLLTPQGEIRWIAAKVATMKSVTGEVIGYVGIDEDITDCKLAEQKIRQQAALLDIASDAISVRDLNHCILYWNQGAERLYGWQASEAIDRRANELLQDESSPLEEIFQRLLEQGEWRGEICKMTKAGKKVIVEARWTLVRNQTGQPQFILSVDTDITDKKKLEAQFYRAQRLESLGTLASGIAHDLNNVLTPILAISQLLGLKLKNPDARSQEMLQTLEDSAKRGADMIKQILTFTRGTGGECSPVQITALLWEVIHVIQQTFPKSISIRHNIPDQIPYWVFADSTYLHQILMNLCVNARDAMPDGGILSFSVESYFVDQAFTQMNLEAQVGNYVVVTVADTGMGIPLEVRDRIFDPFFTTKAHGQGTGLGLATVLGIVKNYGGFLQVFSEVGQGTQFKVYLPAIEETATHPHQPQEPLNGNGELVLVVDDDAAVRCSTQSLLESHHFAVLSTNDGREAIALYSQHQTEIKLVILDVMMPNMSGISLIQQLKQINPTVKIIAMSGLPANREPALTAGATAFLPKPFSLNGLLENLRNLLR